MKKSYKDDPYSVDELLRGAMLGIVIGAVLWILASWPW